MWYLIPSLITLKMNICYPQPFLKINRVNDENWIVINRSIKRHEKYDIHVSIRDRSNYRTASSCRILAWISIIMTFCFIRTELRFLVKRIFRLIHPSTDLHSSRLMSRSRFSRLRTSIYDRLHSCLKTVHLALIGL